MSSRRSHNSCLQSSNVAFRVVIGFDASRVIIMSNDMSLWGTEYCVYMRPVSLAGTRAVLPTCPTSEPTSSPNGPG